MLGAVMSSHPGHQGALCVWREWRNFPLGLTRKNVPQQSHYLIITGECLCIHNGFMLAMEHHC